MNSGLPEGWSENKLEDVAVFIRDGTHATHERLSAGIPLLSAKNVLSNGTLYWDTEDSLISEAEYKKIHAKYIIEPNDILLTVVGTLGRAAIVQKETGRFTVQRSVAIIRTSQDKIDSRFCFQSFLSDKFQKQLELRSNSTAQAGVYLGELAKIEIPIPPLPEQEKIAAVLGAVDDVIEKTALQIKKLNDLKKSTMNELLTKGIGHTDFKPSELGQIPKSWEVVSIEDLAVKVGSGITPRGGASVYTAKGAKLIRSQNVHFSGLRLDDVAYIPYEIHDDMKSTKLLAGDVLLNITGASIGRCTCVPVGIGDANVNQHVCIIRCNTSVIPSYLTQVISSYIGQLQIERLQAGGNREGLNFQQIREIKLPLPNKPEQKQIASILDSISAQIEKVENKLSSLNALKKSLMQDLLSGKVRVRV